MTRVELLLAQMDEVYGRLRMRLEGLTDAEYFWDHTTPTTAGRSAACVTSTG